jgi:signal transduction histidine kinase/ligand-binding sensor domain-containing protein
MTLTRSPAQTGNAMGFGRTIGDTFRTIGLCYIAILRTMACWNLSGHRTGALLSLLLCLCPSFARGAHPVSFTLPQGQEPRSGLALRHFPFGMRDGAPGDIRALVQSRDGFIWIGTSTGLFRYDGARFVREHEERLSSASVSALMADRNGDLWVGYLFGGVSRLHLGQSVPLSSHGLPGGTVHQILRTADDTVWVATGQGLARLETAGWRRVGTSMGYFDEPPYWMGESEGSLVVVTATRALRLERGASHFVALDRAVGERIRYGVPLTSEWSPPADFPDDQAGLSLVDRSGALWVANGVQLRRYRWSAGAVAQPVVDSLGLDDGLTGQVFTFLEDREGNIWAGTIGGLDRFGPARLHRAALPNSVLEPLLIPTPSGGVLVAGRGSIAPSSVEDDGSPESIAAAGLGADVIAAALGPDGALWTLGNSGLRKLTSGKVQQLTAPLAAAVTRDDLSSTLFQSVAVDASGVAWVSIAHYGLFRLRDRAWSQPDSKLRVPAAAPVRLLSDGRKRLWMAFTANRIAVVEAGHSKVYSVADGLSVGNVLALDAHDDHTWAAGDMGLAVLVRGRFISVRGKGGERFRGASGMLETPDGELWLNAAAGLFRIPSTAVARLLSGEHLEAEFELFDLLDGLDTAPEVIRPGPTLLRTKDGRIWISRYRGVWWLDPAHIYRNQVAPLVSIESVRNGGIDIVPAEGRLLHVGRSLRVSYTAASFTKPERVRFRYRLAGLEGSWQDAGGRREAFYTNLPPGSYTFMVEAANEDGLWSQSTATLHFSVAPAYYETVWFRALCGLVLLLIVYGWLRIRLEQTKRTLRQRMQERHAERESIARDLHDTLMQGIQALLFRLQLWANDTAIPVERRAEIGAVVTQARGITIECRERLLELRHTHLEAPDLVESLKAMGGAESIGQGVRFDVVGSGKQRHLRPEAYDQLLVIAREAIRNAYQHSRASLIRVSVVFHDRSLRLQIVDDGLGIDTATLHTGKQSGHFGLAGMRERAAQLGAHFKLDRNGTAGTRITVTVPGAVAFLGQWRWPWVRPQPDC